MFRKKNRSKKRSRALLSAYSIIMILIVLLGVLSHVLPKAQFTVAPAEETSEIDPGSGESKPELPAEEIGPGEWEGEVPAEESEAETEVLPAGE